MVKKPPIALTPQELREEAPPAWLELQDSLAESSALALLLVEGHQPPAVAISNNNSICRAFQSSPEYVRLCDPYCGVAHARATEAGATVEYKCHAGLSCFAKPVEIGGKKKLAVIGGRAFVTSADYRHLMERFRTGDLQDIVSDELFGNILFSEPQRLKELAQRIDRATQRLRTASSNGSGHVDAVTPHSTERGSAGSTSSPEAQPDLHDEIQRLRRELEYRERFTNSLQHFLERISCTDPAKTYNSIVSNLKELLQSERSSLMVLDESANQLVLKAASGLVFAPPPPPSVLVSVTDGKGTPSMI